MNLLESQTKISPFPNFKIMKGGNGHLNDDFVLSDLMMVGSHNSAVSKVRYCKWLD